MFAGEHKLGVWIYSGDEEGPRRGGRRIIGEPEGWGGGHVGAQRSMVLCVAWGDVGMRRLVAERKYVHPYVMCVFFV